MTVQLLINAILQQTMVFLAQVATAGGARAPLAHMADSVFIELTRELQNQGVTKKLIADMFGMTLRTYHRRVRELSQSQTDKGRTVWEAVLDYVRHHEPVTGLRVRERFQYDDPEVVAGVLNDLVHTGLCYRSGRGDGSAYRLADEADFLDTDPGERSSAYEHLVWLAVYRNGPASAEQIGKASSLSAATVDRALRALCTDGRVEAHTGPEGRRYTSERFDVPVGETHGWEAAVLDHYQAMVTAVSAKLRVGSRSQAGDTVGGGTYSLDVGPQHPQRDEALALLASVRRQVEDLRERIDATNDSAGTPAPLEQVVFYMGQYVKRDE